MKPFRKINGNNSQFTFFKVNWEIRRQNSKDYIHNKNASHIKTEYRLINF